MDSCSKSSVRDSTSSSPFETIIFDLDETLYSEKLGIGAATKRNIDAFLMEKLGFSEAKASSLRVELFKSHGSSLAGLRAFGYDIDAEDYHSVVHGRLPYHVIKPDPQLRTLLLSIKQRKIIFTNSDIIHATKALDRLGIRDCFEQIICFETMNPNLPNSTRPDEFPVVLKPSPEAMEIAIQTAQVDPRRTLFLDDSPRNIAAGKAVGLRTVLVSRSHNSDDLGTTFDASCTTSLSVTSRCRWDPSPIVWFIHISYSIIHNMDTLFMHNVHKS
ncbi:OLC1v1020084C2 [Oldenlandia corymbosa var. corymbosa]|uniref:OLC1v1020084C2 n=1 Tax=Oldenlandia corymbosa var. corymbosa TaxID=529605 RepID=A0AAV1EFM3_OLDCO|nr:OLC1v1020084C2 [Oldenlandia corymbosa var. corymbosa]